MVEYPARADPMAGVGKGRHGRGGVTSHWKPDKFNSRAEVR
jgi:hypothetical protein